MTILICIFLYVAVAGVAIFGLLVAAYRFTDLDDTLPWILCGVFWPVTSLPAIGYLAAAWYINRKEISNESKEEIIYR